jgi:hypothetical protein
MLLKLPALIQLFSACATLVPIFVCVLIFTKSSRDIRLFFLFLLVGFLTDMTMFVLVKFDKTQYLESISNIYSLVEASFFYWLVGNYVELKLKHKIKVLYFLTVAYWLVLIVIWLFFSPGRFSVIQLFDPIYEIMISFLSGFILLQMVEKEDSLSDNPMFWIFIGIFFYCFSIFFIATFLNTKLSEDLWFLHNIFNIITLGFYTLGLWKYYMKQKLSPKI